jgi:hypothetical protein
VVANDHALQSPRILLELLSRSIVDFVKVEKGELKSPDFGGVFAVTEKMAVRFWIS